jgi:hypothetical protein
MPSIMLTKKRCYIEKKISNSHFGRSTLSSKKQGNKIYRFFFFFFFFFF